MTTQPRPGRSLKRIGTILMAAGALVGIASLVFVIRGFGGPIVDAVSSPIYSTPFQTSAQLNQHRYVLLQQTGNQSFAGYSGAVTLGVDDVQVRDPNGNLVPLEQASGHYHVSRDDLEFTSAITFQATVAGRYQVTVQPAEPSRVILARDVDTRSLVPWFGGLGIGGLGFVLGFILLLVGFSQQRRSVPAAPLPFAGPAQWQPQLPPPGWYADPQFPGQSRYWDGYRWQP